MAKVDHRKTHLELVKLRKQVDEFRELAPAGMEVEKLKSLLTESDKKVKRLSKEVKELKDQLKKKPEKKKFFDKE